jgi:hypothetical protein
MSGVAKLVQGMTTDCDTVVQGIVVTTRSLAWPMGTGNQLGCGPLQEVWMVHLRPHALLEDAGSRGLGGVLRSDQSAAEGTTVVHNTAIGSYCWSNCVRKSC